MTNSVGKMVSVCLLEFQAVICNGIKAHLRCCFFDEKQIRKL